MLGASVVVKPTSSAGDETCGLREAYRSQSSLQIPHPDRRALHPQDQADDPHRPRVCSATAPKSYNRQARWSEENPEGRWRLRATSASKTLQISLTPPSIRRSPTISAQRFRQIEDVLGDLDERMIAEGGDTGDKFPVIDKAAAHIVLLGKARSQAESDAALRTKAARCRARALIYLPELDDQAGNLRGPCTDRDGC